MKSIQNYEEYWKLTLEYTDFNSDAFITTLSIILDKIDNTGYIKSSSFYNDLQIEVLSKVPKTSSNIENQLASTRKAINQFIKMGFVESGFASYHPMAREYINARTARKRKTILSKIVYESARFNASATRASPINQMSFLINTLVENGKLTKMQLAAIMLVDIPTCSAGYLTSIELDQKYWELQKEAFDQRKYNQIAYFCNLLNKLDDIVFHNDELYFTEDANRLFGDLRKEATTRKRDQYLHLLYKNQLKEEVSDLTGNAQCMVEDINYPVLIASHIKPFIQCNDSEAYDPNNGLLLSRTLDSLFDLGYITFNIDGRIVFSPRLDISVQEFWHSYSLDMQYLNLQRLDYLEYHRHNVFR